MQERHHYSIRCKSCEACEDDADGCSVSDELQLAKKRKRLEVSNSEIYHAKSEKMARDLSA